MLQLNLTISTELAEKLAQHHTVALSNDNGKQPKRLALSQDIKEMAFSALVTAYAIESKKHARQQQESHQ